MQNIPMDKLIAFGEALLKKHGVSEEDANYLSELIVETEAFRQSTHGLVQFTALCAALKGKTDPKAVPKVIKESPASAMVDGTNCIGNLTMKYAKELAVKKAAETGVAFISVHSTQWIGAVGLHLLPLAEQGFLSMAWVQSSACRDCAPVGGIDARFSTNPIALAFPAPDRPVVADFSTATMSMAAAVSMSKKEETSSIHRFIDKEGSPTGDPKAFIQGGTLMFAGGDTDGHKGYALSLFIEALTVLAGGSANNPGMAESLQSYGLLVLDPEKFSGAEYYQKEMQRFVNHVKSTRRRQGVKEIRLPGERGLKALEGCRRDGIPLDEDKQAMLNQLAKENNIDPI